jgi:ubiquinone/menaquinone biosynthesis C-methylase UbiE
MNELNLTAGFKTIDSGIYSALENVTGAAYDSKAKMYEKLVSSRLYNKIIWGTSPDDYTSFSEQAIHSANGLVLDAGCGGLIQTSGIYRTTKNRCVLIDNSSEMLSIAKSRLVDAQGQVPSNITLLQADAFHLPFPDNTFDTVCSFGMIHIFDDKQAYVNEVLRTLKPGGSFYFSSMTTKRAMSAWYMGQLQKMKEFGVLFSEEQTLSLFQHTSLTFKSHMKGSMVFIEGNKM